MAKAQNPISKGIVWVILLLLIVGLAGFGATSFGGSTRVVGTVGDTEIGVDQYARALQQEIRSISSQTGQNFSIAEARQLGLDTRVLQRLVSLAALEDEAADLGLSVGDEEVARTISEIPSFQGANGFDRDAYRFALQQAGLSIAEFEAQLRDETARSLLQGAVVAGIEPPAAFVDTLFEFAREERDLTLVRFGADDLDGELPEPTDDELQAYYEANEAAYTLPRRKTITYAWLTPEMMADTVEIDDETLRATYEERADQFRQPERRLVERLVFPDEAAATEALEAIEAGESSFDDLVTERGLALGDVDLGDVSRSDLGSAADAVFALDEPGLAGPAPTPLGPALFRINAILAAQETPFEEARDELAAELPQGAAIRAIQDVYEPASDLLAGGATLEEVAEETAMQLGETTWSEGEAGEDGAAIDAYTAFREAARATEPGDFPELLEFADGGVFALRVDEVLEPELQPLDAVRDQVVEGWRAQALRDRLVEQAEAAAETLDETGIDEIGGAVTRPTGLTRDAQMTDLPADALSQAFSLDEGGVTVLPMQDGALLIRVDAIAVPGGGTEEAQAVKEGVRTAAGQGIAQDITSAFTSAIESQRGISLNQSAINAVLTSFN